MFPLSPVFGIKGLDTELFNEERLAEDIHSSGKCNVVSRPHPSPSAKEWQMLISKGLRGFSAVDFPENTQKTPRKTKLKCTD
jgi:hypothetical protein